ARVPHPFREAKGWESGISQKHLHIPGNSVVSDAVLLRGLCVRAEVARSRTDDTWKLKFTGDCSQAEFQRRCREQPYWYHSFYFENGFAQRGEYDIGRDVAGYGFPSYLRGMSVLDIGTGSGWFAAYFEQRGAEVVT